MRFRDDQDRPNSFYFPTLFIFWPFCETDAGYLGYEVQDWIDWAWEHRISDFEQFGI